MKDILKALFDKAIDYKGSKKRKISKGILGAIIVLLIGALGLEVSNTDYDLGKLFSGSSLSESKVLRDKEGNIVTDDSLGKSTNEYNCDDFDDREQAQRFYINAGGPSKDTNDLDRDKDGEACE